MSAMALRSRRQQQPASPVDDEAALAWERMGFVARFLTDTFSQRRAAYMRQQHRLWKAYGRDRFMVQAKPEFDPNLLSHWLGKR